MVAADRMGFAWSRFLQVNRPEDRKLRKEYEEYRELEWQRDHLCQHAQLLLQARSQPAVKFRSVTAFVNMVKNLAALTEELQFHRLEERRDLKDLEDAQVSLLQKAVVEMEKVEAGMRETTIHVLAVQLSKVTELLRQSPRQLTMSSRPAANLGLAATPEQQRRVSSVHWSW